MTSLDIAQRKFFDTLMETHSLLQAELARLQQSITKATSTFRPDGESVSAKAAATTLLDPKSTKEPITAAKAAEPLRASPRTPRARRAEASVIIDISSSEEDIPSQPTRAKYTTSQSNKRRAIVSDSEDSEEDDCMHVAPSKTKTHLASSRKRSRAGEDVEVVAKKRKVVERDISDAEEKPPRPQQRVVAPVERGKKAQFRYEQKLRQKRNKRRDRQRMKARGGDVDKEDKDGEFIPSEEDGDSDSDDDDYVSDSCSEDDL